MKDMETDARKLFEIGRGRVHLMGIAGVGMAGLAAHLQWSGFSISGCDLKRNSLSDWLSGIGVTVCSGHSPEHVGGGCQALIRSTAVPPGHPEVLAAERAGIPVLRRGDTLAAMVNSRRSVAIGGTHGKTTTAAMLVQVLRGAGIDAGFLVGAEVDRIGGVAGTGRDLLVAEADESDGTLIGYRPDYAILTNADIDHLEHYADEQALWDCFGRFVLQTGKCVVYNHDDLRAREIAASCDRSIGYGFTEGSLIRGSGFRQSAQSCRFELEPDGGPPIRVDLPVAGLHNASNALAVCATAFRLQIDPAVLVRELALYQPPRRRFEHIVRRGGADIYMDYSHHPTEIRALLQSVADMEYKRLIAIFQPHRYTRTLALGADFPDAFEGVDRLIIAPVFPAAEDPIVGGRSEDLLRHFERRQRRDVVPAQSLRQAWDMARDLLQDGDILLLIGAGDIEIISAWAQGEPST